MIIYPQQNDFKSAKEAIVLVNLPHGSSVLAADKQSVSIILTGSSEPVINGSN